MTKWPVQNQTHITAQKHAEYQDATDIQKKKTIFVNFGFLFLFLNFLFLKRFLQEMLSYRHGNDFVGV